MERVGTVSVSVFQGFGEGVKEVAFSDIEEAIRAFDRIDPQEMPRIVRDGKTLSEHDVEAIRTRHGMAVNTVIAVVP